MQQQMPTACTPASTCSTAGPEGDRRWKRRKHWWAQAARQQQRSGYRTSPSWLSEISSKGLRRAACLKADTGSPERSRWWCKKWEYSQRRCRRRAQTDWCSCSDLALLTALIILSKSAIRQRRCSDASLPTSESRASAKASRRRAVASKSSKPRCWTNSWTNSRDWLKKKGLGAEACKQPSSSCRTPSKSSGSSKARWRYLEKEKSSCISCRVFFGLGAKGSGCFSKQVRIFKVALRRSVKLRRRLSGSVSFWPTSTNIKCRMVRKSILWTSAIGSSVQPPASSSIPPPPPPPGPQQSPNSVSISVSVGTTLTAKPGLWLMVMSNLQTFSRRESRTWQRSKGEFSMRLKMERVVGSVSMLGSGEWDPNSLTWGWDGSMVPMVSRVGCCDAGCDELLDWWSWQLTRKAELWNRRCLLPVFVVLSSELASESDVESWDLRASLTEYRWDVLRERRDFQEPDKRFPEFCRSHLSCPSFWGMVLPSWHRNTSSSEGKVKSKVKKQSRKGKSLKDCPD